jgi:uncharacterized protein
MPVEPANAKNLKFARKLPRGRRVFLSAEWRDLAMLNYEVDPFALKAFVPTGTELDSFAGKTFVTLVGFRFLRTRLWGLPAVPFHASFDEVNLRFYVRRRDDKEIRRGVVFIREIVPRRAVAYLARFVYGENYSCHPMRHEIVNDGSRMTVVYQWRLQNKWCQLYAHASGAPGHLAEGSLEQFVTEHYWGYSSGRRGCLEYHVSHPVWRVWPAAQAAFEGEGELLYGPELGKILERTPDSAFIADGSPVLVFRGEKISP